MKKSPTSRLYIVDMWGFFIQDRNFRRKLLLPLETFHVEKLLTGEIVFYLVEYNRLTYQIGALHVI